MTDDSDAFLDNYTITKQILHGLHHTHSETAIQTDMLPF